MLAFFFAIDGINFIVYEMSYLELLPEKYLCTYPGSTEAVSCTPDDFCGQDSTVVSWQADFTDPDAYYNWNQKLDLACRSPSEVGLLGSVQFGGWVITLLFVPRLSDIIGRKLLFMLGAILMLATYAVILITTQFWVMVAALFVVGLANTFRC